MDAIIIIVFFLIGVFLILELIFRKLVYNTRKNFQWMITTDDELPKLSIEGLKKFFVHGYDPELGWVRKPNTSHVETGKYGTTEWHINENGTRSNPNFDSKDSFISCYGDSFTFSRQVNDDETWEHKLSKKINSNVQNLGVGNYGVDQALLRLKRDFPHNKTDIVIIGVVPDTISRILSVWKHYSEYGNTFGFKPRFTLKNNSLKLIKNIIDNEEKFTTYDQFIDKIRKYDYFYETKFRKDIIKFPFTISLLKKIKRNFGIIYWVKKIQESKKRNKDFKKEEWEAMKYVMYKNLELRVKLFQDKNTKILLRKILEEFVQFGKEYNFKPVFVFLPQKDDLLFIKKKFHFYNKFQLEIKSITDLTLIDVTERLLQKNNLDELYSDDNDYGGHYSREGNEIIASILKDKMEKMNLI